MKSRLLGASRTRLISSIMALAFAMPVGATVINLDFETPATGSNLLTTPLVTLAGTIALSNATAIARTHAGSGDGVVHDEIVNPGFALFSFDFDFSSVSFTYSGNGSGVFTGEVLDIGATVVDSFFDPDTSGGGDPFGPLCFLARQFASLGSPIRPERLLTFRASIT